MSDTRLILVVSLIVLLLFATTMIALAVFSAGRSADVGVAVTDAGQTTSTGIDSGIGADSGVLPARSDRSNEKAQTAASVADRRGAVAAQGGDTEPTSDSMQTSVAVADPGQNDIVQYPSQDTQVEVDGIRDTDDFTEDGNADPEPDDPEEDGEEQADDEGDQTLAGRVVNDAGQQVAGLTVFIQAKGVNKRRGKQVKTDRGGAFEVRNLKPGDYLIQTQETPLYRSVVTSARSGVTTVKLTVTRSRQLTVVGAVRDESGQAVSGVEVSTSDGRVVAGSDERGGYKASVTSEKDQPVVLMFRAQGYVENSLSIDSQKMDAAGIVRQDVTMQLLGDIILSGVVTDEQLNPIEAASVLVNSGQHDLNLFVESNAEGEYRLDGLLAASDYRIQVIKLPDYLSFKQDNYSITGSTELNVPLAAKPTGRVWGYLVNLDGTSITNQTITAIGGDVASSITSGADDGLYEFNTVADRVSFTFGNSVPRVEMRGPAVHEGDDVQLDLVVNIGENTVSGQVVSEQQQGVPAAALKLIWEKQIGNLYSSVYVEDVTDANGMYSFSGLGSGTWELTVQAPGYAGAEHFINPQINPNVPPIQLTRQARQAAQN